MRGGPASVMGNLWVKRCVIKKRHYWDNNNLIGTRMCHYVSTGNIAEKQSLIVTKTGLTQSILDSKVDHEHAYFGDCDLEYAQNIH